MLFRPGSRVGPFVYDILVKKILGKYEDQLDNAVNTMDDILQKN